MTAADHAAALVCICGAEPGSPPEFHSARCSENRVAALLAELEAAREREATTRAALLMLWEHYLLPISDEQKAQVWAALAAGGDPA